MRLCSKDLIIVLTYNENQTVYDEWIPADGYFEAEDNAKWITFISSTKGYAGFVRVVGREEGYTGDKPKKFYIPAGHSCEVLGCRIMFTRA
jgi:hypothetical protein